MANWATNWNNCIWCGVRMSRRAHQGARALPAKMTREHLYPAERGGWMVVPACAYCNSNRRSLSLYVFWKSDVLRNRRTWSAPTAGYARYAPAAELVRLYLKGKPRNLRPRQALSA